MSPERTASSIERKRLYLVRHADAGDPAEWIGPDAERPLSSKGVKQAARLAAALVAAGTSVGALRTSPARRCTETCAVIAAALETTATIDEQLADGPTAAHVAKLLARRGSDSLLLVGHQPHLGNLIAELTGITTIPVEKGSMIRIDIAAPYSPGSGQLVALVPPAHLRAPK
ncbi:MAG: SixA phosphatase family protein, partial [Candidatus Limnocylindrus sp.]